MIGFTNWEIPVYMDLTMVVQGILCKKTNSVKLNSL